MTDYKHTAPTNRNAQEHSDELDASLHRLYENRKQSKGVPPALKQNVMAGIAQKTANTAPWWKQSFKQYVQISMVTASFALVALVIGLQMIGSTVNPKGAFDAQIVYQSIQIHELTAPNTTNLIASAKEQRFSYNKAYSELLAKQKSLMLKPQTHARVIQFEGELQLLSCEDELIKISQDVINLFYPKGDQAIDFSHGQMLTLRFEESGHIAEIHNYTNVKQC